MLSQTSKTQLILSSLWFKWWENGVKSSLMVSLRLLFWCPENDEAFSSSRSLFIYYVGNCCRDITNNTRTWRFSTITLKLFYFIKDGDTIINRSQWLMNVNYRMKTRCISLFCSMTACQASAYETSSSKYMNTAAVCGAQVSINWFCRNTLSVFETAFVAQSKPKVSGWLSTQS